MGGASTIDVPPPSGIASSEMLTPAAGIAISAPATAIFAMLLRTPDDALTLRLCSAPLGLRRPHRRVKPGALVRTPDDFGRFGITAVSMSADHASASVKR